MKSGRNWLANPWFDPWIGYFKDASNVFCELFLGHDHEARRIGLVVKITTAK